MRPGWLFFSLLAVLAIPGRFRPIFYEKHNLDEAQIGIVLSIPSLFALFTTPFISGIADRSGNREIVTAITGVMVVLAFLSQIPALPSLHMLSQYHTFWYLLASRSLYGVFESAIYPLVSAIAITQLEREHGERGHQRFGQERMFGSASWAAISLILGLVLDIRTSQIWLVHVGIAFFGVLFLLILFIFVKVNANRSPHPSGDLENKRFMSANSNEEHVSDEEQTEKAEGEREAAVSKQPLSTVAAMSKIVFGGGASTLLFFNLTFWLSVGMSLVENLLFLYLTNGLDSSNFICGVSVLITVIFQFPIFARSPYLLNKYGAPTLAMVGAAAFGIRAIGYAIAPNPWFILFVEPLHGVTYGMFHTASVAYVVERTPKNYEATGQSVLSVVQGLAKVFGPLVGGYVIQIWGSRVLYATIAVLVCAATVCFWCSENVCAGMRENEE